MRIVLAIFFIIAGTAAGLYRSAELKKREILLAELLRLLEKMSAQIRYRALPLGDLFTELDSAGGGKFINKVAEYANNGVNRRGAWNEAVCDFGELDPGDREILLSVGNSLGGSDIAGQLSMLELSGELLAVRQREAAETSSRKGAVYRSVGLLAGLGLAIIVI